MIKENLAENLSHNMKGVKWEVSCFSIPPKNKKKRPFDFIIISS